MGYTMFDAYPKDIFLAYIVIFSACVMVSPIIGMIKNALKGWKR